MQLTRRSLLLAFGASAFASVIAKPAAPLGLELYSLRRELAKDLPRTLKLVRKFGFEDVEVPSFYGLNVRKFRAQLDSANLTCSAMVAQYDRLSHDLEEVIGDARELNARYVICPWIPHQGDFSEADCRRASADMNRWGDALKQSGLHFCYHPHGFEFGPGPAGTLFDLLVSETDPALVHFEADVFWIAWPGQDPVTLLSRYPKRFLLMHLKDIRKGTKLGDQSGTAPEETSVQVGTGMLDFPAIVQVAKRIAVKRYYIEDEAPEAESNISGSLRYLKSLGF